MARAVGETLFQIGSQIAQRRQQNRQLQQQQAQQDFQNQIAARQLQGSEAKAGRDITQRQFQNRLAEAQETRSLGSEEREVSKFESGVAEEERKQGLVRQVGSGELKPPEGFVFAPFKRQFVRERSPSLNEEIIKLLGLTSQVGGESLGASDRSEAIKFLEDNGFEVTEESIRDISEQQKRNR